MRAPDVETAKDFLIFVDQFASRVVSRSHHSRPMRTAELESYLRALYATFLPHSDQDLTWSLFAQILEGSLLTSPVSVDLLVQPPSSRDLILGSADDVKRKLIRQILYLHELNTRFAASPQNELTKWGSAEKNWENTSIARFIESGSRAFSDSDPFDDMPCEWGIMWHFLNDGQYYE